MHLTEHNLGCSLPNVGSEQSEAAGGPEIQLGYESEAATLRFGSHDDALYYARKTIERAHRRFVRENRHITERYVESEFEINVELTAGFHSANYHLVFNSVPRGWSPHRSHQTDGAFLGCFDYAGQNSSRLHCGTDRNKNSVFVGYTELIQGPEGNALPSFMRLEGPKERVDITWDILAPTGYGVFDIRGFGTEGECCVFKPLVAAGHSGRVSGLVEGRSEIINNISGGISNVVWQFLDELDFVKLGSSIRVGLNDSGVWATLEESGALSAHISKVTLCIRDPAFRAVERVICEANHAN
jgi:hypothetical protein